ncbi:circularly permutated Ras protein 1-like [Diadema antillarum]|uniref:circularly permutated Ras protein 1-like n=1 Tax=Diadema antillarum TaxID=105358 RepID=UPI003A87E3AE
MDFGSSHVFTQADSDTEELITAEDLESPYGVYQPLGIYQPLGVTAPGPSNISQPEVLYDNVIRDEGQHGTRGKDDDPVYDNRGFQPKPKPQLPKRKSGDYAKPYDHLKRESHPYEYAGVGSFVGNTPPPLPPMRKNGTATDDMGEPIYGGFGEGEYTELIRPGGSSKVRRADTNIVAIKFDKLVQSENSETGSPVLCGNCGASMSHLSSISQLYSGKFWVCEYCEFENPVSNETQVPSTEDNTFLLGQGSGGGADTLVIFCVDVSGSMAVTTEVSGNVEKLPNDERAAMQAYQEELDAAEQRSRQAEQEAYHAQMVATYQGAIEEQAQALAQFSLSRTQSQMVPPPQGVPPGVQVAPSAPFMTIRAPPPARQSVANSVAPGIGSGRVVDVDERYVPSPVRQPQAPTAQPQAVTPQPTTQPPPPRQNVCYVSRLQSMQTAIQQQVAKLVEESSMKRVGLVAFNNNVTVVGDGSLDPVPLEGAGLTDKDSLISLGENFPLPGHIVEVHRCLTEKIYGLTESGQTALGPALLIAISMAAQKPGSKVIMCTDGMANVGLGSLHDISEDAAYEAAATFYDEVGDFAQNAGVCVSVLTLEGEDCRAIELGSVADKTRGQVSIVHPNDLNQQFAEILNDPVLATNVSAKMVLHRGLFLRDSDKEDNPSSQATHLVGLVTEDSETTFEFGVRKKEVLYDNFGGTTVTQREEEEPVYESVNQTMIDGLERLPFQVQIRYTGRDGLDYLRILTMDRPVTKDRKFAEQNANVGVIGVHAAQSAAKLAVEGDYTKAKINAIVTQKLVERCTQPEEGEQQEGVYQTFLANMAPIHSEITRAQEREVETGQYMELEKSAKGRTLSQGDSESDDAHLIAETTKKKKMSKKMKQRRRNVSDHQASVFYRMKGATTKMFNKQGYNLEVV